jgi:hypothetical protein
MNKKNQVRLKEAIDWFVQDASRRAVQTNDTGFNSCKYSATASGKETDKCKGCLVGYFMDEDLAYKVDSGKFWDGNDDATGVSELIFVCKDNEIELDSIITENEDIMSDFQEWHDSSFYWGEKHMTSNGVTVLFNLIEKHDLDKEIFNEYLINK